MNELGKKIKQRREELGLSQDKLARMLGYKHKSSIKLLMFPGRRSQPSRRRWA